MKSVVTGRDSDGNPVWNNEYADFMKAVGFATKLCKPRHPFTKGAVLSAVFYYPHILRRYTIFKDSRLKMCG